MNEQNWDEQEQMVALTSEDWLAVIGALISNADNADAGRTIATRIAKQLYFEDMTTAVLIARPEAGRAALDNPPLIRTNGGSVYE